MQMAGEFAETLRHGIELMKLLAAVGSLSLIISSVAISPGVASSTGGGTLLCVSPSITDGDTLRCEGQRVRLLGIDAPEMPGHCRAGRACVEGDPYAAKAYLVSMTRGEVKCLAEGLDNYGRTLARCSVNGADLSCAMIAGGHAVPRYRPIYC